MMRIIRIQYVKKIKNYKYISIFFLVISPTPAATSLAPHHLHGRRLVQMRRRIVVRRLLPFLNEFLLAKAQWLSTTSFSLVVVLAVLSFTRARSFSRGSSIGSLVVGLLFTTKSNKSRNYFSFYIFVSIFFKYKDKRKL